MTNVDQFESVFRSASKPTHHYQRLEYAEAMIVTDLDEDQAYAFAQQVKKFLATLEHDGKPTWDVIPGNEFESIDSLLEIVTQRSPDLICTYRHLHSDQWKQPYTLGEYVEVLTQATPHPVLVLPHPEAGRESSHAMENTNVVMAMTDHLAGDHKLVNIASRFTEDNGVLFLTHVENEANFERTIEVISKIQTIDTDLARNEIAKQLLKEPIDFIQSCRDKLGQYRGSLHVEEIVVMGHRLDMYRKLVETHQVDLLVLNTKDEDQLAMHGLAYPLAVELREIPLLML